MHRKLMTVKPVPEQDIGQKNVCSGWTICVNEGTNSEEASIAEDTQTLLATPN